jgi:hypothetical protein
MLVCDICQHLWGPLKKGKFICAKGAEWVFLMLEGSERGQATGLSTVPVERGAGKAEALGNLGDKDVGSSEQGADGFDFLR